MLLSAGASPTGLPPAVLSCAMLYLTTEALSVFEQDYARSPSRQTAVPWLAFVALYRLPVWHYIGYTLHAAGCSHLVPVAFALIAMDCSAWHTMACWLDEKHTALSQGMPPNMWISFCELFGIAALYSGYKASGADTRARLNAMYSLTAEQYDATRKLTLFGRETLIDVVTLQAEKCLAAIAATTGGASQKGALGMWLDIGGGTCTSTPYCYIVLTLALYAAMYQSCCHISVLTTTNQLNAYTLLHCTASIHTTGTAENLLQVSKRLDLSLFSHIFVVDYSDEMCAHARACVAAHNWSNVTVVQADAATFRPPTEELGRVGFVTASYSLSMIPGYCALVDAIASYSDERTRIVVADFYTSKKNDTALRQHSWWRRWLMQAWFAIDDVDLSPHRREVCEQRLTLAWESNHMGKYSK
jgi:hypothetical protein